ncbi:unnamed protein product [Microthlaspi erraticum]|uniref:F-box domain-containing protein n=1 Tax=Microthlaspi erraticum TaxID=1685480 RepID=A0A6D2INT4_9BRAS|nr:unnamed protein product [Microthlaspi erraticum]
MWVTNKIVDVEADLSWSKFAVVLVRPSVNFHAFTSLLIDEEKKVAVCCEYSPCPRRNDDATEEIPHLKDPWLQIGYFGYSVRLVTPTSPMMYIEYPHWSPIRTEPEDLWAIILSRLPLKTITASKMVCKQWKSVVQSQFLRELFLSRHQNSHSSWSLMCKESQKEVVAHYGCDIWGLERSLGSYISSFVTDKRKIREDDKHRPVWFDDEEVSVVYTDVGLILISFRNLEGNLTYHVANPITRQYIELPPLPRLLLAKSAKHSGLATRTENGVVLSYKVVLLEKCYFETNDLSLEIFSSDTGLWSFNTLRCPQSVRRCLNLDPFSLNGKLYWLGGNSDLGEVVVSHDFYATGTESNRCKVIPFPDLGIKPPNFRRSCTTSQGSLMYMNIFSEHNGDGSVEHKLSVWRLKSDEWRLVSQISPACIKTRFDYFPLTINPFDANTMYLLSRMHKCLASTNVHKGKFGLHNNLERSSNGRTLIFAGELDLATFSTFALPLWLSRIPSPPSLAR